MGAPLAFLATATEAVDHRCITSTAFGGLPRDRGSTRNRMVKPNPPVGRLVGRRIRLIGLLMEKPRNPSSAGVSPIDEAEFPSLVGLRASPVHHEHGEEPTSAPEVARTRSWNRVVEPNLPRVSTGAGSSESRLLNEEWRLQQRAGGSGVTLSRSRTASLRRRPSPWRAGAPARDGRVRARPDLRCNRAAQARARTRRTHRAQARSGDRAPAAPPRSTSPVQHRE